MTNEEKQLLIKDLCARLPYVTFVYVDWHKTEELEICEGCEDKEESNIHTLISCDYYGECNLDDNLYKTIYDIKPYLRPMSSMSEDENIEYNEICLFNGASIALMSNVISSYETVDWLNAHHFDYRGLIEKGLALEAKEGMYYDR